MARKTRYQRLRTKAIRAKAAEYHRVWPAIRDGLAWLLVGLWVVWLVLKLIRWLIELPWRVILSVGQARGPGESATRSRRQDPVLTGFIRKTS